MSTAFPTTTPFASTTTRMSTAFPATAPLASTTTKLSTAFPTTMPLASTTTRLSTAFPTTTPFASTTTKLGTAFPTTMPLASTTIRLSTAFPTTSPLASTTTRMSTAFPTTTPLTSTTTRMSTAFLTTRPLASTTTRLSTAFPTTTPRASTTTRISTAFPTTMPLASTTTRMSTTFPKTTPLASTTTRIITWPTTEMKTTLPMTTPLRSTTRKPVFVFPPPGSGTGGGQISQGTPSTAGNTFAFTTKPTTRMSTTFPTTTPLARTTTRMSTTLPMATPLRSTTKKPAFVFPTAGSGTGGGQISQGTPSSSQNTFAFTTKPTTTTSTTTSLGSTSRLSTLLPAIPTTLPMGTPFGSTTKKPTFVFPSPAPETKITTKTTYPSPTKKVTTVTKVTVTPSSTTTTETVTTTQIPLETTTETTEASTLTPSITKVAGGGPLVVVPPGGNYNGSIGVPPVTSSNASFVFTGLSTLSPSTPTGPAGGGPVVVLPPGGSFNGSIGIPTGTTAETSFRFTGGSTTQSTSTTSQSMSTSTAGGGPVVLLPPGGTYNGSIGVQPGTTDEASFIFTEKIQTSPTSTTTKTVITSPTKITTKEITVSTPTPGSTTKDYCIEGSTRVEKERFTLPVGPDGSGYINSDVAWTFPVPAFNAMRENRPQLTVVFEEPVRLLGVDLQGKSGDNTQLMYAVAVKTEENGDFDKFVGSSMNLAILEGDTIESKRFDSSVIPGGVRQARLEVRTVQGKTTGNLRVAFHSCKEESILTETTTVAKTTTVPTSSTTPSSTSHETSTATVSETSTSVKTTTQTSTTITSTGSSTTAGECMDPISDRETNRIGTTSNTQVGSSTFKTDDRFSFDTENVGIFVFFDTTVRITAVDLSSEGVKEFTVLAGPSASQLRQVKNIDGLLQVFTVEKSSEITRIMMPDVTQLREVRVMKLDFKRALDGGQIANLKTELVGCVKELPSTTEVVTTLEVTVEAPLTTEATTTEHKTTKSVTTTPEAVTTEIMSAKMTQRGSGTDLEGSTTQEPRAGPSESTTTTSTVTTTNQTPPGAMKSTKEATTTTVTAKTKAETTTKTTSTAKTIQLVTAITKENCSDVLTGFTGQTITEDGTTPESRTLTVPFTTPVTLTGVKLQGDSEGNTILSFAVRYRLYEETLPRALEDESGLMIFNVPWDVDVTDPVIVSLPFLDLDNIMEVTLFNLNVPDTKAASFIAEFQGCVKLPMGTPSTSTMVTSTTSTTLAPTTSKPEMLNTIQSSTVITTTAKGTTTAITRQTVKKVTEPEKLCTKDLSTFDGVTVTRSTAGGSLEPNEQWVPSAALANGRDLFISFNPPVVVRSLIATQDEDFEFIGFYSMPGSSSSTIITDSDGRAKVFQGGVDQAIQYLSEDMGEIEKLRLSYISKLNGDDPDIDLSLFGCFDHLTTTAVTTTVSKVETIPTEAKPGTTPKVEIKTTKERVSLSPTQKVTVTATSVPGKETATVKETVTSSKTVTESVVETQESGVTTYRASTTVTSQQPISTSLGVCMENLETSPALTGLFIERSTSMPDNGLSSFRSSDVWMPSTSDGAVPFVRLESDHALSLTALKIAGDGQGRGVTSFQIRYLPYGSSTETYYTGRSSTTTKTFTGSLTTKSDSPVWIFLDEPTEPIQSLTVEILSWKGNQPALNIDFFGCAGHPLTTTRQSTFERVTSPEEVITTVTESINNVITSRRQTIEPIGTTTGITTTETQTPQVGVTTASIDVEGSTTEMTTTTAMGTTTEAIGCMYNGIMYKYGEELPSRDPCTRMLCELGSGILEIREECDLRCDGKLRYVEEQCCPVCEKESKQCLRKSELETLRIGQCVSEEPVEFTSCTGWCPSRAFIDMIQGQAELRRDCRCCQPLTMGVREARLNCNGVIQGYSYKVIEECSCQMCTPDEAYDNANGR